MSLDGKLLLDLGFNILEGQPVPQVKSEVRAVLVKTVDWAVTSGMAPLPGHSLDRKLP